MASDILRDGKLPPQRERMQPPELINRLNDRSRPAKRPPLIDWQHLLSAEEKNHLSELLVIQPKAAPLYSDSRVYPRHSKFLPTTPPPPIRPFNDQEHYQQQATELLGKALCETSLYYSPQVIKFTPAVSLPPTLICHWALLPAPRTGGQSTGPSLKSFHAAPLLSLKK